MYTLHSILLACHVFDTTQDEQPKLLITPAYIQDTENVVSGSVELWVQQEYEAASNQLGAWMTGEFETILEVIRLEEPDTALRLESLAGQIFYQVSQRDDLTDRTQVQTFKKLLEEELNQRVFDAPTETPDPSK